MSGSAAEVEAIQACNPAGSFGKLLQLGLSTDNGRLPEWLPCILSCMGNLELLKLGPVTLSLPPTMCWLKHVMLELEGVQNLDEGFYTQIGQLKCLETLAILYTDKCWASWQNHRGQYGAEMAALDLTACAQLRAISFVYIYTSHPLLRCSLDAMCTSATKLMWY